MTPISDTLDDLLPEARRRLDRLQIRPRLDSFGRIESVGDGIAHVSGLPEIGAEELLVFPGGVLGLAVDLSPDLIGCFLLGPESHLAAGDRVHRTSAIARVPVGKSLLGRVVDPLGNPLDNGPPIVPERYEPTERSAPAILDRAAVTEPLQTGITIIDAMFPLGRGQRELIIGDRATGKTSLTIDTIINQRDSDVICVYVAVGQMSSAVQEVIAAIREKGAFERTIFVVGLADGAPGLLWLAPFAGFTMAEFFRDLGAHALIVIDDVTKHAAIHRQLSLLLHQPPGREAYPGDVFHLHARLLERSAKLAAKRGGGSLTALPIAETQAGNLSAYIPTNLISITDGQIYLDAKLVAEAQRPAVDVGRSVSRVGGKTQAKNLRRFAESLRLDYAQFLELEVFTRFGGLADERTRKTVEHGRRIRALLAQPRFAPEPLGVEVAQLVAVSEGILDDLSLDAVPRFRSMLRPTLIQRAPHVLATLNSGQTLDEDANNTLKAVLQELVASLEKP